MAFLSTVYAALGSALSANGVLTELAASNGYAREATAATYDPVTGLITFGAGVTFGPVTSSQWTAATFLAFFDASTSGNLLLVMPIPSARPAVGGSFTPFDSSLQVQLNPFVESELLSPPVTLPANAVLGRVVSSNNTASKVGTPAVSSGASALLYAASGVLSVAPPQAQTVVLTDGTHITTDCAAGKAFSVTLAGSRTLDNPLHAVAGNTYRWFVNQDSVGSHALALGSAFKTEGGAPTLSGAASAVDSLIAYYDGTTFWGRLEQAYA